MQLLKTYTQLMPAFRFIGKKYGEADQVNGSYSSKWAEAFESGFFSALEAAAGENIRAWQEDADAYVGLIRYKKGEPFMYAIGMFLPPETAVPEGYDYIDFPETRVGVGWIKGKDETGEIYGQEKLVMDSLTAGGVKVTPYADGVWWTFERYACPRFTSPDEDGNVILDVGFFLGDK